MSRIACLLAFITVLVVSGAARASDPIGGFMIVDKVVFDPSDNPTTIQIWGSFVLAAEQGGKSYTNPERGYLYYKVPSGKEVVTHKEWNDLTKTAGTTQVIGFGNSYNLKALGKIRKSTDKPQSPDTYPLGNGLVKIDENANYPPARTLLALPAPLMPADGDLVPPGEITLVVRNNADKTHAKAKYVFELEAESGGKEAGTTEAGDKETKWMPKLQLKAGEKYIWRVWATEGDWKGPLATSHFVVKGEK